MINLNLLSNSKCIKLELDLIKHFGFIHLVKVLGNNIIYSFTFLTTLSWLFLLQLWLRFSLVSTFIIFYFPTRMSIPKVFLYRKTLLNKGIDEDYKNIKIAWKDFPSSCIFAVAPGCSFDCVFIIFLKWNEHLGSSPACVWCY